MECGRLTDAITANRLAVQINPNDRELTWSLVTKLRWVSQRAEYEALLRTFDVQWPEAGLGRQYRFSDAVQQGDYSKARATLADVTQLDAQVMTALRDALSALQRGDVASKAVAADRLKSLRTTRDIRWEFVVEMLATLGRDDDALEVAESSIYGPQVPSTKLLFQPALAPARALPAFATLAERLGLIAYWQKSGHAPDFCLAAARLALCARLPRGG